MFDEQTWRSTKKSDDVTFLSLNPCADYDSKTSREFQDDF